MKVTTLSTVPSPSQKSDAAAGLEVVESAMDVSTSSSTAGRARQTRYGWRVGLMGDFGIGASVRRKEDFRFLTGQGTYTDDINRPGQLYAVLLRSPHAHAELG